MNFGEAIEALKAGKMVTRNGWNGKGMFLWLKPETTIKSEWCVDPVLKSIVDKNGGEMKANGTICMKTADNRITTGWTASQPDMLADDWMLYNENKFGFELPKDGWNYRNVRFFRADVDSVSWDDATVNGEEDDYKNPKIPCFDKKNRRWNILIDIKTGQIINWEKGNTASVYYKVVDTGEYTAYDNEMNEIVCIDDYAPKLMAFDESGYGFGDYFDFEIDENGFIKNWPDNEEIKFFIDDFIDGEEE